MPAIDNRTGLIQMDKSRATPGYTLFTPLGQPNTYIVDMNGEVVHQWDLPNDVGNHAYLLDNGNLLAAIRTEENNPRLPAKGGHLIEYDWDGNIVWEHVDHAQHHDFHRKANGNTVYAAWELIDDPVEMAKIPGGRPGMEHEDGIYTDVIREVDPAGNVVWEWRAAKDLDLTDERYWISPAVHRKEFCHANTVFVCDNNDVIVNWRYNAAMVRINPETKEVVWSHQDDNWGQHNDVQELENGNILFFGNRADVYLWGPETGSEVIEMNPANNEVVWRYTGHPRRSFFSWFISGAQRLASGNTMICEGLWGRLFEVTPEGDIVWEYVSPFYVEHEHPAYTGSNPVFRCQRHTAESKQIRNRLPDDPF